MFIRSILQDLLKLEKLIYNTKEGNKLQLSEKKYILLTVINKIILY